MDIFADRTYVLHCRRSHMVTIMRVMKRVGALTFRGACKGEAFDRGEEDGIKKLDGK